MDGGEARPVDWETIAKVAMAQRDAEARRRFDLEIDHNFALQELQKAKAELARLNGSAENGEQGLSQI